MKIELSQEEEKEIRDYQSICKAEEDSQLKIFKDRQDMKKNVVEKIKKTLELNDDEIKSLFG